ncbi:MAG: triose-phosphate isomerase [Chitinophagaceae bacterium]|jgi:triosephosphate isomerase|nr:triose-phosphate isomerase [Chitinophagaceae bacterium]
MRKEIAAANWKMNITYPQAEALIDDILQQGHYLNSHRLVIFGVPFPYLKMAQDKIRFEDNYHIAAQNMHHERNGAFTGEISAEMLHAIGVEYVIIGHSERRIPFNETNEIIAKKIDLALEYEIKPIFCCGEPLEVRDEGKQNEFVQKQIEESLFHLSPSQFHGFVIAYEPIWAIGTGKTATDEQAQEMHAFIRTLIAEKYGQDIANSVSILYGGSIKSSNAKSIFSMHDVDGGLVGGASLIAADFGVVIDSLKKDPEV